MPDSSNSEQANDKSFLPKEALPQMIDALHDEGFKVIAPVRHMDVIALRPIERAAQMAVGLIDEQDGGKYRLADGDPTMYFEAVVGATSPKNYFFPSRHQLFAFHTKGEQFVLDEGPPQPPKLAFIGVRACDLAAIGVQDRVFGIADHQVTMRCESETYYQQTREQSFLVAVDCTRPGGTCFCASWGTGPAANELYDVAMTELRGGFVVRAASEAGQRLLERLPLREPSLAELELAALKLQLAAQQMGRHLDTDGVKEDLDRTIEHPHWDEVAQRCLSCGNCAMVCPTCFCSVVIDQTEPGSERISRVRELEPCYTHRFTYQSAGGPSRNTIRGRYRHWLRHKVCTWWDQFDCSGCVGCGRCITWCPVGIDLTEEIPALRETHARAARQRGRPG